VESKYFKSIINCLYLLGDRAALLDLDVEVFLDPEGVAFDGVVEGFVKVEGDAEVPVDCRFETVFLL